MAGIRSGHRLLVHRFGCGDDPAGRYLSAAVGELHRNAARSVRYLVNAKSLPSSAWRYIRDQWYVCGLTLASVFFVYGIAVDWRAGRHLESMVQEFDDGSGLLVVTQVGECVQTLVDIDEVVDHLQDLGVPVHGLVIEANHSSQLVAAVVEQANTRFRHETVAWRVVQPLLSLIGTPAVIGVSREGRVLFVDHNTDGLFRRS